MKNLFRINQQLSKKTITLIEISGFILILLVWYLLTANIGKPTVHCTNTSLYYLTSSAVNVAQKPIIEQKDETDTIICTNEAAQYQWYFNGNKIEGETNINYKIRKNGDYFIETTDFSGKKVNSDTIQVRLGKGSLINRAILPSPGSVLISFKELHFNDFLVRNTLYSIKLNVLGYIYAIIISIILGFIIGLIPFFKSMFSRYVEAIRFLPLTALTGLFIAWFGIETNMKVQFLAFGIIVYLLPVVVYRISQIDNIYLQTAYTMGASDWQLFRRIYWPFVTSKIFDDIRVLTAISWTYIIVAEMVNKTGGVGALLWIVSRQSRLDKVFALLIVIMIIGVLQDRLFIWLDKVLFPYKHK
jgi:ABC-type nitrate/sulfonate/bicarbonate transport system permease component